MMGPEQRRGRTWWYLERARRGCQRQLPEFSRPGSVELVAAGDENPQNARTQQTVADGTAWVPGRAEREEQQRTTDKSEGREPRQSPAPKQSQADSGPEQRPPGTEHDLKFGHRVGTALADDGGHPDG